MSRPSPSRSNIRKRPERSKELRPSTPLSRMRVKRARTKAKVKAGGAGSLIELIETMTWDGCVIDMSDCHCSCHKTGAMHVMACC